MIVGAGNRNDTSHRGDWNPVDIRFTSAVPALDPFVPAAAGATTAAPPRGGMWGRYCSEHRRRVCAIICGSRPTRNAELDINWSDGLRAAWNGSSSSNFL